jgi:hypothetical protein
MQELIATSCFLPTDVDARDTSASTRVFDALLPAHDGKFAAPERQYES